MNRTLLGAVLLAALHPVAANFAVGATIVMGTNIQVAPSNQFPPADHQLTVTQDLLGDQTTAWINLEGSVQAGYTLKLVNFLTDEGAEWFVAAAGDVIDDDTFNNPALKPLFTPPPFPTVPVENEFYLGVKTGNFFSGLDQRDAFGWARFQIVSGALTMVENVMSYQSPGIVVGTTQLVPEPGSTTLLSVAFGAFGYLTRQRNRQ